MKSLFTAAILAISLLVGGCATTSGNSSLTNKNPSQSIEINKTTKDDISRMYGAPTGQHKSGEGDTWIYTYNKVSVVPFFSSADFRQLNISFDKKGVVTAYDTLKNGY